MNKSATNERHTFGVPNWHNIYLGIHDIQGPVVNQTETSLINII